jgi:hypothetical protein
LLAGPNITINYQPNGIAITGSAGGGGTPKGPDRSIQFNNGGYPTGIFDGNDFFIYDSNFNVILQNKNISSNNPNDNTNQFIAGIGLTGSSYYSSYTEGAVVVGRYNNYNNPASTLPAYGYLDVFVVGNGTDAGNRATELAIGQYWDGGQFNNYIRLPQLRDTNTDKYVSWDPVNGQLYQTSLILGTGTVNTIPRVATVFGSSNILSLQDSAITDNSTNVTITRQLDNSTSTITNYTTDGIVSGQVGTQAFGANSAITDLVARSGSTNTVGVRAFTAKPGFGTPTLYTGIYGGNFSINPISTIEYFPTNIQISSSQVSISSSRVTLTTPTASISNFLVLTQVSQSLNFANDTAAAAGGVPKGGIYRNGNAIQIRLV